MLSIDKVGAPRKGCEDGRLEDLQGTLGKLGSILPTGQWVGGAHHQPTRVLMERGWETRHRSKLAG